jgi:hypothetical protein
VGEHVVKAMSHVSHALSCGVTCVCFRCRVDHCPLCSTAILNSYLPYCTLYGIDYSVTYIGITVGYGGYVGVTLTLPSPIGLQSITDAALLRVYVYTVKSGSALEMRVSDTPEPILPATRRAAGE